VVKTLIAIILLHFYIDSFTITYYNFFINGLLNFSIMFI